MHHYIQGLFAANNPAMGLWPDTQNCGLPMRQECRERFPRHPLQMKLLVSTMDLEAHFVWNAYENCMQTSYELQTNYMIVSNVLNMQLIRNMIEVCME